LTISSVGSTTLTGSNVFIKDPIVTLSENNVTIGDLRDRGVEFRYYNPSLPGTSSAFFGWDNSANAFTFLQNTTNSGEIISGTLGNAIFGNTTVNNLTVTGTISGVNTSFSTEHLTLPGNSSASPANNINITFVKITSSGTTIGTLTAPGTDGYSKYIFCSSLASGAEYHLICPAGILLDPGSGTTLAKKIKFDTPGQSLYIIWDNLISSYIVINGNACISTP
jgi:hypothetical protein